MTQEYSTPAYKEYLRNALLNKRAMLDRFKVEKKREGTLYSPVVQAAIQLEEGLIENLTGKVLWME